MSKKIVRHKFHKNSVNLLDLGLFTIFFTNSKCFGYGIRFCIINNITSGVLVVKTRFWR